MPKLYHKCAALLLAVGILLLPVAVFAEASEESSTVVGLSSVDSGPPPATDNGYDSGSAITYTATGSEDNLYYTATRADWALDALPKPEIGWLFQTDAIGNSDKMRKFSVRWSQSDYNAGLASGAKRFTLTGSYVPANAEDQVLWDKGLLRVDGTSVPKMEVQVTNAAALPFRVELGRDEAADGYYPIFAFPLPHGASEVRFEASDDGTHWFACMETYNNVGAFIGQDNIYSMQYAIYTEDGEPFFFDAHKKSYYRVTVYGSAYDANGCGAQSTYTLNAVPDGTNPPDSSSDDIDGNRGGGTQGESDRPGKEPEKELPKQPAPEILAPVVEAPPINPPESSAPSESGAASAIPDAAESTPPVSSEPQTLEVRAPIVEPSSAAEPPAVEEPPAAEPPPPPDKGNAGTVAATTTAILVAGAGGAYLFKIRRKP